MLLLLGFISFLIIVLPRLEKLILLVEISQAKAAMQSGLRKGNARERLALGKISNDGPEYRRREQIASSSDSSRYS